MPGAAPRSSARSPGPNCDTSDGGGGAGKPPTGTGGGASATAGRVAGWRKGHAGLVARIVAPGGLDTPPGESESGPGRMGHGGGTASSAAGGLLGHGG
eukprot:812663-Alexandrium_andersonii.AAC.1